MTPTLVCIGPKDSSECVENAECTSRYLGQCQCVKGFYAVRGGCRKRKLVGEACEDGQCVEYALCASTTTGTCFCRPGYYQAKGRCAGNGRRQLLNPEVHVRPGYYNGDTECMELKQPGETCFKRGQCVENTACSSPYGGKCECLAGLYREGFECKPVIPAGQPCSMTGQCVENAECSTPSGGVCECGDGFYEEQGTCFQKKQAGQPCTAVGQCVDNANCALAKATCECQLGFFPYQCVPHAECTSSAGGLCQCEDGYYVKDGSCAERITVQRYCAEEGQCVDNAECSERTGTCECNEGYYHENGRCKERVPAANSAAGVPAGDPCITVGQCVVHAECSDPTGGQPCTGLGQCVLNAECTTNDGGLCDCALGYFNYGGTCREVLPAGDPCTGFGQCVTNAECSTDTGGTCDCNALFYEHNGTCNPKGNVSLEFRQTSRALRSASVWITPNAPSTRTRSADVTKASMRMEGGAGKWKRKAKDDTSSVTDSTMSNSFSSKIPKPYVNYAVPFYYPAAPSVRSFSDMPIYMRDLGLSDVEESASGVYSTDRTYM
nr:hypothetical protein BaRGS_028008 [Batillaria attramentaria]